MRVLFVEPIAFLPLSKHTGVQFPDTMSYSESYVHTPSRTPRTPGGSTLYIAGLSDQKVRGGGCSSAFRSTSSFGDAHIKDLQQQITPLRYAPPVSYMTPRGTPSESRVGTSAFASSSSDRHSYIPKCHTPPCTSTSSPVQTQRALTPSASFKSKTPIACAHFVSMTKPTDPHFVSVGGSPQPSPISGKMRPTSSFKSSSGRDSYIKALPQTTDAYSPLRSDFDSKSRAGENRRGSSAFVSATSIGDAHIKAVTKPVDTCVAYRI